MTQHPDSTQDIVEMAKEETEDEDEDEIWLTDKNQTNSVEKGLNIICKFKQFMQI